MLVHCPVNTSSNLSFCCSGSCWTRRGPVLPLEASCDSVRPGNIDCGPRKPGSPRNSVRLKSCCCSDGPTSLVKVDGEERTDDMSCGCMSSSSGSMVPSPSRIVCARCVLFEGSACELESPTRNPFAENGRFAGCEEVAVDDAVRCMKSTGGSIDVV